MLFGITTIPIKKCLLIDNHFSFHIQSILMYIKILALLLFGSLMACKPTHGQQNQESTQKSNPSFEVAKSENEWKSDLTDQEYYVLRQCGTERAFTGEFWGHKENGTYTCGGCGQKLFSSETKYKSGSGWPSFFQPIDKKVILEQEDKSLGASRIEILCSNCGGHLGHVFEDGPQPTGLRYCVNSVSLDFEKKPD